MDMPHIQFQVGLLGVALDDSRSSIVLCQKFFWGVRRLLARSKLGIAPVRNLFDEYILAYTRRTLVHRLLLFSRSKENGYIARYPNAIQSWDEMRQA